MKNNGITRVTSLAIVTGALLSGAAVASAPSAQAVSGASVATWNRVAKCESGGNWKIATGNGYYGGLQFSNSTWRAFGGTKYAKTANRATKAQQIAIANKLLRAQGWKAWPACSKKLKLR